jgi:UDP-N-acetylmuramate--alanine ligase
MTAQMLPAGARRVHFVGIGGAGMSGIARILLSRGIAVSGSDAKESRALGALRALGGEVYVGHDASHVGPADAVVVSSAIRANNVEVVHARDQGIPVIQRAAALAGVMAGRRGIAVAGTHGKTTTTSMLTIALQYCGADPSFAIGGDLNEAGSNAHHGSGELFVAEADESDGSFLLLSPYAAIVTNVDADHLDHYGDEAAIGRAFVAFLERIDPDGFAVLCADDPGSRRLVADSPVAVRTYGESQDADLRIEGLQLNGLGSTFEVVDRGRRLGPVRLRVPGRHNAMNAAAALSAGIGLGLPSSQLREGLARYDGVRRRFEYRGEVAGVRVFDDYSHNPTKVTAALRAARHVAGTGRVFVVFQPHRYTRTLSFAREFGAALALADEVLVMEVYAAGEDPIPGVTGQSVAAAVPLPANRVSFEGSWAAVAAQVAARTRAGDIVLTMGAGDVTQLAPEVLAALEERASA